MTKMTATDFGKLSPEAAYSAYDNAFAGLTEARSAQADALAAVATYEASAAAVQADNAAALQEARDDAAAAIAAKEQEKQDALAAAQAQAAAALAAAVAPLNTQIATLTTQIAGSAGSYAIAVTPLQLAGIQTEIGAGHDPAEWFAANVVPLMDAVTIKNQATMAEKALAKYPTLPDPAKAAILTVLDLGWLIGAPLEQQGQALSDLGLMRFLALPIETRLAIWSQLGF